MALGQSGQAKLNRVKHTTHLVLVLVLSKGTIAREGGGEGPEGRAEEVCEGPERSCEDELWEGGREETRECWRCRPAHGPEPCRSQGECKEYKQRGERDEDVKCNCPFVGTCSIIGQ